MADDGQTLYDRIGGASLVESLVGPFYERVLADPELRPFFIRTSMDKLRRMQSEFFTAALDGPVKYQGMDLSEAHWGKGITPRHMQRFLEHLLETLKECDLSEQDVDEIYQRISVHASDVIGGSGESG